MKDNGTDRDVALQLVGLVDNCTEVINQISNNLYGARITTQPEDTTGAVDAIVHFSVVATNVKAYRWQYKSGNTWTNSNTTGATTDTITITVTEARYEYTYRCKITGKDDVDIYTDEVKINRPEPTPGT